MLLDYFLKPDILARPRGNTIDAKIICPQAFGRNTWTNKEAAGRLQDLNLKEIDDIARFNFLEKAGFDPGSVNRNLAEQCFQLSTAGNPSRFRPIVGQWEVLYAVWKSYPDWYECNNSFHQALWPPTDRMHPYLSTRELLQGVDTVLHYWPEKIAIVAQSIHLGRCVRLADKIFGKRQIIVPQPGTPLYDSRSVQPWTRNQRSFLAWERGMRLFEELPAPARTIVRKLIQR